MYLILGLIFKEIFGISILNINQNIQFYMYIKYLASVSSNVMAVI